MVETAIFHNKKMCDGVGHKAILDTLHVLNGKWKIPIIGTLTFNGKVRFNELLKQIDGIGAKMLSKELKELELNELVARIVAEDSPANVYYELTDYGKTLHPLIHEMSMWGQRHRERIMKKKDS